MHKNSWQKTFITENDYRNSWQHAIISINPQKLLQNIGFLASFWPFWVENTAYNDDLWTSQALDAIL